MDFLAKILVVDDEPGMREMLAFELGQRGYEVASAANGEEAMARLRAERFQLVISDVKMPKMGGIQMLEALKKLDPGVEVIMSTGFGTIETAVGAMKKGAYDFIQKPFNLDEMAALVEKALEKTELKAVLGVYESSKAVLSSLKLEELLPLVAGLAVKVLKADDASIMLRSGSGCLEVAAAAGLSRERGNACLLPGESVAGLVAQDGEPVIINGPLKDDPRFGGLESSYAITSAIVYPLYADAGLLGVLNVNRVGRPEQFTAADLRYAAVFCSQISQAIRNAELYRRLGERLKEIQGMQAQLVRSERLAAVGQLSAGIAHEINNPLGGIMGFAEMLLKSGLSGQQREDAETILRESRRLRDIVQDLLRFGRGGMGKSEPVDLAGALESALRLAAFELRRAGIAVERSLAPGLPKVRGDGGQLQQVFLNVVMNACHAMEGGKGGRLRVLASAADGRVTLRFEDNGTGIPVENLDRIFEPFFTTKPSGKGTGLGLSVSYGIIQEHKGTIRAENVPGGGAAFVVELPAMREAGEEAV